MLQLLRILPEFNLQVELLTSMFHPFKRMTLITIVQKYKRGEEVNVSYDENPFQLYLFHLLANFSNDITEMMSSPAVNPDSSGYKITEFLHYQQARQTFFLLILRLLRITFETYSYEKINSSFSMSSSYSHLTSSPVCLFKKLNQYLCLYTCLGIYPSDPSISNFDYIYTEEYSSSSSSLVAFAARWAKCHWG